MTEAFCLPNLQLGRIVCIPFDIYCSNMKKAEVSDEAKDKQVSEWLWKLSEKWTMHKS